MHRKGLPVAGATSGLRFRSGGPEGSMKTPFKLLSASLIQKGNLLARVQLEMPSGMIVAANVLRSRKDPDHVFVLPVGERQQGGGFAQIVDFASPDLREAWQNAALETIRPRMTEILGAAPRQEAGYGGF